MKVEYDSNNSGGSWWLSDNDWLNLEKAGWTVHWQKDSKFNSGRERFLGALATSATVEADSVEHAIRMWQEVIQQDPEEAGCPCCGQPHSFREDRE